ncbi:MAG TPA: universal stress protein [Pedococcus sp.]|nr:universal stress protein [Pedococcus sp.]
MTEDGAQGEALEGPDRFDSPAVAVRRAYETPAGDDGTRVLVDRVWPRGLRRSEAHLDEWCKEVAPSKTLREWYAHDPAKFDEFSRRYRAELTAPQRAEALQHLRELAEVDRLTLLTGTRDPGISQAAVVADILGRGPVPARTAPGVAREAAADTVTARDRQALSPSPRRGWIVVGVDGSESARSALLWAIDEARMRRCSVRAVMAWHYSSTYGETARWPVEGNGTLSECEQVLGSAVADARQRGKDGGEAAASEQAVEIASEVVKGHPGRALLVAAVDADLLVVGSRGRGGLVGALLGSVSQYVVAHARCPVVVVHGPGPARDS